MGRLFWRFASDSGTASSSGAESGYPVTNVQTATLSSEWRSDGTDTTDTITIDLGSAQSISACAVLKHNFEDDFVQDLTLRYASDSGFSSDVGTETLTFENLTDVYHYFTAVSRRYWRLEIDKGSVVDYTSVGRFVLGDHTNLTYTLRRGGSYGIYDSTSSRVITEGGQIYGDIGVSVNTISGVLIASESERTEIEALKDTYQTVTPFIFSADWENYPTTRSIYGIFDSMSVPVKVAPSYWEYNLDIRQQR
ncbi:MAG: discoidin domain-containing protein [Candidatus Heimdallarchaeaceae archaeon]